MKGIIIVIIILVALVGGILVLSDKESVTEKPQSGSSVDKKFDKAPEFSLPDFEGNIVSLSDSTGKIRVVNSWAAWCPFCVEELDDFAQLQEAFSDEIVVIAIDRAESLDTAKGFADELGVTNRITMLLDPKDSFYTSIGGFSMPETLFVDGEGNIRIHKRGPMKFEEMKEKVESIINSS